MERAAACMLSGGEVSLGVSVESGQILGLISPLCFQEQQYWGRRPPQIYSNLENKADVEGQLLCRVAEEMANHRLRG